MANIWTIARREYRLYFASPIAYIVALLILLTLGIIFVVNMLQAITNMLYYQSPPPDTRIVVAPLAFLLVLATPALTMRLLSDEQRMGTMELLLTAPVREWELVIGKWLGSFLFILTVIGITLIYPLIMHYVLVDPGIDQGVMLAGYLGVILVAAAFLAIGTAMSSFFQNQFAAFFATLVVLVFFWWMVGWPANVLPVGAEIFRYFDMSDHFYNTLSVGTVALSDIVYFLSMTGLGLFLGSIAVEIRRWK